MKTVSGMLQCPPLKYYLFYPASRDTGSYFKVKFSIELIWFCLIRTFLYVSSITITPNTTTSTAIYAPIHAATSAINSDDTSAATSATTSAITPSHTVRVTPKPSYAPTSGNRGNEESVMLMVGGLDINKVFFLYELSTRGWLSEYALNFPSTQLLCPDLTNVLFANKRYA